MMTLTQGRFQTAGRAALQARPGPFAALVSTLQLWRRRIDERNALAGFTWRDMSDIGISQTDVTREINKPFWKA
jgi:uncharacterized protein YjiS (DUF1127 family)